MQKFNHKNNPFYFVKKITYIHICKVKNIVKTLKWQCWYARKKNTKQLKFQAFNWKYFESKGFKHRKFFWLDVIENCGLHKWQGPPPPPIKKPRMHHKLLLDNQRNIINIITKFYIFAHISYMCIFRDKYT